jgi:hypothetical protein
MGFFEGQYAAIKITIVGHGAFIPLFSPCANDNVNKVSYIHAVPCVILWTDYIEDTMPAKDDIGRDQSIEHKATTAERDAGAAQVYAANRDVAQAAGMIAAATNRHNEAHLAGGAHQHGKGSNAIGDDVLDAAAKDKTGMEGYEAAVVASQGVESQYLNPTMQNDAFAEGQRLSNERDGAIREADRASPAQGEGGPTPADAMAAGTDGLTLATAHSAQSLSFGGRDAPAQERMPGGAGQDTNNQFAQIMEKSGLRGAFADIAASGATMGGRQGMFGDAKGQLAAPATPGQEEHAAKKAEMATSR